MTIEKEKYVDESWKESAAQEKEKLQETVGRSAGHVSGDGNNNPVVKEEPSLNPSDTSETAQDQLAAQPQEDVSSDPRAINFLNYSTSLVYQSMVFLGEIPNPVTQQTEKDLEQAKLLIDTLIMLREKTQGNLNEQETNLLSSSIYELEMKYVALSSQEQET